MAKVAAGEIDAATATELIAAARKDYESNVPVTTSAQQAVQPQQTANPYQADPQTAYAVPEMEPEQTPIDYGQFATSTNYPHTYDVEDSSDVDMDALSGIASDVFDKQPRKKLSRKERKAQAKEMKKLQKESNAKLKANAKSNKSIQKQLKDRDKELSKKNEFARYRRKTAKDVTSFIGYNRMYEDGICEVEEGMFSSCICFEDTSYHSVREDAQKAVFTSICRLYDQFGADTLVQFNIINTPLLKEQIFSRDNSVLPQPDSLRKDKSGFGSLEAMDSLSALKLRDKARIWNQARTLAKSSRNMFSFDESAAKEALNQLYRSKVEWHKKISLPVSIMIFFLIGAPLGAIIRKGGLGLPVVVSIIFFVIYYIISLSGEKLAKEGSWEAVYGIWLSTFILTPIAVYLTYKATNDSALLDTDWYAGRLKALNERMRPAINKLKNAIKLKRNGKKHDSE